MTKEEKESVTEANEMRQRLQEVDLYYARNLASKLVDDLEALAEFAEGNSTDDMSYTVWEVRDLLTRVNDELNEL